MTQLHDSDYIKIIICIKLDLIREYSHIHFLKRNIITYIYFNYNICILIINIIN
jgi:hypothetical protein